MKPMTQEEIVAHRREVEEAILKFLRQQDQPITPEELVAALEKKADEGCIRRAFWRLIFRNSVELTADSRLSASQV